MLLIMLVFASHPEVRLMVPVLDAIGLDVLMMLFGAQLLSTYADDRTVMHPAFARTTHGRYCRGHV